MAVIQDLRARRGLFVTENATVAGNAAIQQNITVTNTATFSNTLIVTGAATFSNTLSTTGFANVGGTLQVTGVSTFGTSNVTFDTDTLIIDATNDRVGVNTALGQTVAFMVTGDANVSGTFTAASISATNLTTTNFTVVTGNSNFDSGVLFVDGTNNRVGINNTTPDADLTVTGTANVSAAFRVGGATTLASALGVTGAATFSDTVAVTGATTLSTTLGVTGVATFSNTAGFTGAATFSNTVGVTGVLTATGGVVGALNGIANQCGRSITAGSFMLGGGTLTGNITLSADATSSGTPSKLVSRDSSGNFAAGTISASLNGAASQANTLFYNSAYRTATDTVVANSIVARDGNGSFSANVMTGTATSARYADLAEMYLADKDYPVGTVVKIGGEKEITEYTALDYIRALGTISEKPAFLMNKDLEGGVAVALKGRVPVRVVGIVRKGQGLGASAIPGVATTNSLCYFAIALEDYTALEEGIIEAVIL